MNTVGTSLGTRFDWYEVTWEGWTDAAATLGVILGGEVRQERGRNGYAECNSVVRGEDELVRVYGRSSRIGELHAVITGASCDEVVPLFRTLWPEHRVSRADSAVDVVANFAQVDAEAVTFAERRGLTYRLITDSNGGATRYLGAPTSEVRVRVYKKSEQLRAVHPERAASVPDGVVRFELQARPSKRASKETASQLSADELWGLSQWAQVLALDMLGINAERTYLQFRRPSSWSRSLHFLGLHYGRLVRDHAAEVGRDAAVAEVLEVLGL